MQQTAGDDAHAYENLGFGIDDTVGVGSKGESMHIHELSEFERSIA